MAKNYSPLVFFLLFSVHISFSQIFEKTQKLFAPDGREYQEFGYSLALNETYFLVGATNEGSCYVYLKNQGVWTQISKLVREEPGFGYGGAVALQGEDVIIGDWNKKQSESSVKVGDAYVYKANNGSWSYKSLLPADAKSQDAFGYTISAFAGRILISSPSFTSEGSVYLYEKMNDEWENTQKINNDLREGWFGFATALTDKYALIGAPNKASAYVYTLANDGLKDPVKLSIGVNENKFGYAVSLTNDFLFIGSPHTDDKGEDSGKVHVFSKLNGFWVEHQVLMPDELEAGDAFGSALEVNGDYLFVGADYDKNDEDWKTGAVFVYLNNNGSWELVQRLSESDLKNESRYGFSLESFGNELMIGAMYLTDGNTRNTGAVYTYKNTTLGIDDEELTTGLSLYPNPVSNYLSLRSQVPIEKVEIYSILGQKIKEVHFDFQSIATDDLQRGIYLIKISSERGKTVRKLVKK